MKRIKFKEEKQSYKVVTEYKDLIVCCKPFNLRKTYIYTIVDLTQKVRGPDNMILGPMFDWSDPKEALKGLKIIKKTITNSIRTPISLNDRLDISHRRRIKLNIDWIKETKN